MTFPTSTDPRKCCMCYRPVGKDEPGMWDTISFYCETCWANVCKARVNNADNRDLLVDIRDLLKDIRSLMVKGEMGG